MTEIFGFININKPINYTSMDVIRYLRKVTKIKKIGHAGTLDPLATGVLIVAIGKYTKKINLIMDQSKSYFTIIDLSKFSSTDDEEGEKTIVDVQEIPTIDQINNIIKSKFLGEIEQIPPIYSAIKIKGKKAYDLARQGIDVEMKSRKVFIDNIEIVDYNWPYLSLNINCGKGTYIRSIGRDIGKELNTGGYLTKLVRTRIGSYNLNDSIDLESITSETFNQSILLN